MEEINGSHIVSDTPNDSISSISWSKSNLISTGCWDKNIYTWKFQKNEAKPVQMISLEAPILCTTYSDDNLYSGSCDGHIYLHQFEQSTLIGQHEAPVKTVHYSKELSLLITGSFDKTVKFWDVRQKKHVHSISISGKVNVSSVFEKKIMIGTQDQLLLYEGMDFISAYTPSFSIRSLSLFSNGYAIGSMEGKVSIQYYKEKGYSFKCHRIPDEKISAVHSIHYNPQKPHIFATTGLDGSFNFWDQIQRVRVRKFQPYKQSIPCGQFNHDGTLYAYAVCYDFSKGSKDFIPGEKSSLYILNYYPKFKENLDEKE